MYITNTHPFGNEYSKKLYINPFSLQFKSAIPLLILEILNNVINL